MGTERSKRTRRKKNLGERVEAAAGTLSLKRRRRNIPIHFHVHIKMPWWWWRWPRAAWIGKGALCLVDPERQLLRFQVPLLVTGTPPPRSSRAHLILFHPYIHRVPNPSMATRRAP